MLATLSAGLGYRWLSVWLLDVAVQHGRNLPYLIHHLIKLIREDRLRSIRECMLGIVVHFHHNSICAHGHCRA